MFVTAVGYTLQLIGWNKNLGEQHPNKLNEDKLSQHNVQSNVQPEKISQIITLDASSSVHAKRTCNCQIIRSLFLKIPTLK